MRGLKESLCLAFGREGECLKSNRTGVARDAEPQPPGGTRPRREQHKGGDASCRPGPASQARWTARPSHPALRSTVCQSRVRRCAGVLLVGVLLVAAGQPAFAQERDQPVATGAVQVTSNPAPVRAHSSPRIARNPQNGELVIVEADVRGNLKCNVNISVDDGRSWFPGGDLMTRADPLCAPGAEYGPLASPAFTSDGVLHIAYSAGPDLGQGRDMTPRSLYLARSTDSGRTFTNTLVFDAPEGNPDKGLNKGPTLAVDPSNSDRIYVGWRQGVFRNSKEKLKSNIAASSDGGKTFGAPVDLTDPRGGDYPTISVDGQGVVHAAYWTREYPPGDNPNGQNGPVRPVQYVRSTDNGATFTPGRDIDAGNQQAPRPGVIVADPNSAAIYLGWHANQQEMNTGDAFTGDFEVLLRASLDGGQTWGERKVLNDDKGAATPASQFHPNIAIAPNGRIDVAWYDGRLSPAPPPPAGEDETGFQDVFYTSSTDQGATFTPNIRITDRSIDRAIGVYSNNIDSKTNVGITSTDDEVHFAWQDTRNADRESQPEDIYTAAIRLSGTTPGSDAYGVPWWGLLGAGLLLGLGLGIAAAWLLRRHSRRETEVTADAHS